MLGLWRTEKMFGGFRGWRRAAETAAKSIAVNACCEQCSGDGENNSAREHGLPQSIATVFPSRRNLNARTWSDYCLEKQSGKRLAGRRLNAT